MNRTYRRLLTYSALATLLLGGLVACSGPAAPGTESTPVAEEELARQREMRLNESLVAIEGQLNELDQSVVELRADVDLKIKDIQTASQRIGERIGALKHELLVEGGAPSVASVEAVPYEETEWASEEDGSTWGGALLRVLLVVIILAAVYFIVKIFMGRCCDADEDFGAYSEDMDDADEAGGVESVDADHSNETGKE